MRVALLALLAAGCAVRPVSTFTTIPKDTPGYCGGVCENMGLKLSAVVVISDQVGCVCEKSASDHASAAAAVAAGGFIAVQRANDKREEAWVPGF